MEDSVLLLPLISVFVLILLSAFFSGSETGLTAASRAKIHKLKMEGNRRAAVVQRLRKNKEGLIGAILLGNNLVNIGASAIATSLFINLFGEKGVIWATLIMTVMVLVFAEVLPKTFAVRHAAKVAVWVAPAFVIITKIFAPITHTVQIIVNAFLNIFSSGKSNEMSGVEVLRGAVELYHQEGNVKKEDKDMLSGVFELEDTEVDEVMVHRTDMDTINVDTPVREIIAHFTQSRHSRIPFWKDNPDNIVGLLHTKDLFVALQKVGGQIEKIKIEGLLRKAWFVPETTTLKAQLKAFRKKQQHIALVVDEFGSLTGLITLEDILEEVVGEIEDEHDVPQRRRFRRCRDGSINADGDLAIRDFNKDVAWEIPDEFATTLAGLVMHEAQKLPEEGEEVTGEGFDYKVLRKSGTQIMRIKISRHDSPRDAEAGAPAPRQA